MNDTPDDDHSDEQSRDEETPNGGTPREPVHAQFQHNPVSAIVPDGIGAGVFANGAIVLGGPFEFAIDFVVRMAKPNQVVARVVLSYPVADQFIHALRANVQQYESTFGPIPGIPIPRDEQPSSPPAATNMPESKSATANPTTEFPKSVNPPPIENIPHEPEVGLASANVGHVSENISKRTPPNVPSIEDIYDELKMSDDLMGGNYANAVVLRHTATEFCFDFIANFYPKSAVTSRVIVPTIQIPPLLNSLSHSLEQRRNRPQ